MHKDMVKNLHEEQVPVKPQKYLLLAMHNYTTLIIIIMIGAC